MKKIRLQKSSSNTQALSQKRSSLNQDSLTMSVKPDWRGPSPNIENNNSSKAFFQNMKAELSNIKNDFEKLIRKEINLKPNHDPLKIVNSNKPKQYSSAKKDHRSTSEYQRYQFNHFQKDSDDSYARILNLEKNLPCSSQQKQIISKTVQLREQKLTTSAFQGFDLKQPKVTLQEPHPQKNQTDDSSMLKEAIKQLESELSKQQKVASKLSDEIKLLSDEKLQLIVHVSELNKQLTVKNECILQNERDITQMRNAIKFLEAQRQSIINGESNWLNQKNYLNQQLQELNFHHQQLRVIHQRVIGENDHLRDQIEGMQRYCDDLQARCAQIDADYKRKLQYLQKDLMQYQKRQDMFTAEIEKLTQQINLQPKQILQEPTTASQSELHQIIANLKDEISHLSRQLQIEKQLHAELAKRYENQVADTNSTTDLIKAFEEKNTELVDENGKLKTKVNYLHSNLESLSEQNKSYLEQIRLYEEREKKQEERKRLNPSEWEQMTEEIQRLKENNKKLTQELQYKLIEKESNCYKSPVSEELLRLTHQQIAQLQNLKQELEYQQERSYILASELQDLKMQNLRTKANISGQTEAFQQQLQRQRQKIKSLKNIIFSVIVKKAEKRQYEDDIEHILREIQTIRNSWV